MAYHLDPSMLPGGLRGVDVFFVISGYVVAAAAARRDGMTFAAFIGDFYRRRLLRIAPALLACLLVTAVASMLFVPLAWLSDANDETGLLAFFGLSNLLLAWRGEDYFAPTAEFNPYVHTWSLGVEEQFYLVFPLIFHGGLRGGRLRWLSIGAFCLMLVASLADAGLRAHVDANVAFYLTSARLWEIAAGVLLHQLATKEAWCGRTNRLAGIAAWTSLCVLAVALSLPAGGIAAILAAVVATTGLLAFLHRRGESLLARLLAMPPLVAVGQRSYSLYLWHWPVFVLLRWTTGFGTPATLLAGLVLTFVLAELSWRFVEQPVRHSIRWRRAPAWSVVMFGVASLCGAAALAYGIRSLGPTMSLSTVTRHRADWHVLETQGLADDAACRLAARTLARPARREYAGLHCHGRSHAGQTLFVFGDSHAIAYSGLATGFALQTGAEAVVYANPGCSFGALRPAAAAADAECNAQGREVLADIGARAQAGDILLLSSLRVPRLGDQASAHVGPAIEEIDDAERRTAEATLAAELAPLAMRGIRIVFDAPKPVFRAPAFRCSDAFNVVNPLCRNGLELTRTDAEAHRAVALGSLRRVASHLSGASLFDALPMLCDAARCEAVRDGKPLFFDGDHLSGHANRLLLPAFIAHLDRTASLH
ncbi:MAG: acyltransferase [Xanthomonadales bacterium]|nr:acyltransferase [Xanthomonadales bacterium]